MTDTNTDVSQNDSPDPEEVADELGEEARPLGDESGVYIPQDSAPSETEAEETDAPIDFGGFLVSLSTSCMVNLGHVESPETGRKPEPNLPAAKQTIEILKMLREKTRGNLEPDEKKLFESLLHDTQLAYEEAKERQTGETD